MRKLNFPLWHTIKGGSKIILLVQLSVSAQVADKTIPVWYVISKKRFSINFILSTKTYLYDVNFFSLSTGSEVQLQSCLVSVFIRHSFSVLALFYKRIKIHWQYHSYSRSLLISETPEQILDIFSGKRGCHFPFDQLAVVSTE